MPPPRVILLDIGGVCVGSPFQAILDYQADLAIPPGWISYAISKSGSWQRLETGSAPLDDAFFAAFSRDLHDPARWRSFCQKPDAPRSTPKDAEHEYPPRIEVERLFNSIMAATAVPDPWMVPALRRLKASARFILAALSNTIIFPPGHPLHVPDGSIFPADSPLHNLFDVVISSAHEGVRKPDARAYQLALDRVNEFAKTRAGGAAAIAAGDVVFLDDIGENLRGAARFGFGTVKVGLGRADEAVRTLERITRLDLAGRSNTRANM